MSSALRAARPPGVVGSWGSCGALWDRPIPPPAASCVCVYVHVYIYVYVYMSPCCCCCCCCCVQGLLPFCLLEDFEFWLCEELSLLTGYQRPQAAAKTLNPFRLYVHLIHTAEGTGLCAEASAIVRRVGLKPRKQQTSKTAATFSSSSSNSSSNSSSSSRCYPEDEEDPSAPEETLVNLLLAPEGSPVSHLRDSLLRVEALSHILVWTRAARRPHTPQDTDALSCDAGSIDAIELPR